jgi:hypothetical protein
MRRHPRRLIALFIALAMLATLAVSPASALTLQRKWTAKVNGGTNGAIALRAYTDGSGAVTYNLKNLRKNATYTVQIRKGTCANLGTVVRTLTSVKTTSNGTVARTNLASITSMNRIWPAARTENFVVRIVNGTSARCGKFTLVRSTRIQIPSLSIDMPVIRAPSTYPPCRVGMYLKELFQPTEPGVTFIFAHARTGMFLPLLNKSKINDGASMIGMTVKVWTSNSYVHYYTIDKVRRHVTTFDGVFGVKDERLWLQTSEGPNFTYPKLIIEGYRYKTAQSTYAAAHPTPRPVSC